jgi:Uma2 family endonuclease
MGVTATRMTVEQFHQLPEEEIRRCELIQGEIVPMGNALLRHEIVKAHFTEELVLYNSRNRKGIILPESAFDVTEEDAPQPDVSYLTLERLRQSSLKDHPRRAPDLAVEIVSSEKASFVEYKVELYLDNGAQYV